MKDLDIKKCIRPTDAPDWFKSAMAKGEMPVFGKKKTHLSKNSKPKK